MKKHPSWIDRSPKAVQKILLLGEYVLATKYSDGDPNDQFCVGFYNGSYLVGDSIRFLVVDNNGKNFRNNGFRRAARISTLRGEWIVNHLALIEQMAGRYSVWHWYKAPFRELREIDIGLYRKNVT